MRIQYNLTLPILHSKTKYVNKRDTFLKNVFFFEKSNPQMFFFFLYIYIYIYIYTIFPQDSYCYWPPNNVQSLLKKKNFA